jgi:O-antigen/teichoic acid export membrane protein
MTTEHLSGTSPVVDVVQQELSFFARLLRGAGALYVSTILSFVGRLGFAILVARWAGADALGVFTLGFVSLQVLSMFAMFGIDVALVRYASPAYHAHDTRTLSNVFWATLLSALFLSVIVGVGFWFFIPYYPLTAASSARSLHAIQLFALALPCQVLISVMGAFALAQGNYLVRVFAERIVPAFAQIALLIVLMNVTSALNAVTLAYVFSLAVGVGIAIGFTVRLYPRGVEISDLWQHTRHLYRYSYMQGLGRLVGYTLMNANLFLLGALADSSQVGVYAAASRLTLIGLMFLDAFGQMFSPLAASQRDPVKFKQEFQWITKWIFMASTPLFLLLAIFAPVWMGLMGPAFVASSAVLTILAAAQTLNMITGASAVAQAVRGRPWLAFVNNLLGWGTSAVLTAIWAGQYGALGAAAAYFAAIVVFEILETLECFVFFRFAPFGADLFKPFLALAGMGIAAWLLHASFAWNIFTAMAVCAVLLLGYAIVVLRFGLERHDAEALRAVAVNLRVWR